MMRQHFGQRAYTQLALVGTTCLLAVFFAANATASIQTGDIVGLDNAPGSPGGIFYLDDESGNKVTDTFCVQLEEFVNFNSDYKVADAYATTTLGSGSRSLTSFAAWLYDRYLNGVEGSGPALSNFDFSNAYGQSDYSAASFQANELQLAIWEAMGYTPAEIGGVNGGWYDTYDGKVAGWETEFNNDVTNGVWSGTGDVYVLNLLSKDGNGEYSIDAQDQLIRHPSMQAVPEAGSVLVWLSVAGGCIALAFQTSRKS
ncbi:hypothetical protein NG895_15815 [Aeoliella sp. ICT_H6.2]|uniref:Secreted protein with PEP-CTERM sorting signal n=1 Tax=Aeoliella straminimaris TaxID=2954799 RepID=A0A9X2FAF1_9BACT|nr:hypothetical protein [Aeoliella straminimaris]MCO6045377.1 hypothetical protein [Aeoliella straminimaris]